MKRFPCIVAAGVLALHALGVAAAQRTFVASTGSDANSCSLAQPCRSFARARIFTDFEGEIIVLDSAGYGDVTLVQSVSIIAPPGIYAGITVSNMGTGIEISGGPSTRVVLRGLTINGLGGNYGIRIEQAGYVEIERCAISKMAIHGIRVDAGAKVVIDDVRVTGNGFDGIHIAKGDVVITRTHAEDNGSNGIAVRPDSALLVHAVVRDSVLAGNVDIGLSALAATASNDAHVTVEGTAAVRNGFAGFSAASSLGTLTFALARSIASQNDRGFSATGVGTTAAVSGSTIARNFTYDLSQAFGAVLRSHGNNALSGDGPGNVSGAITQVGLN